MLEYTDLTHDASYMLLRTNPRLTTNVKILYNGERICLETYPVSGFLNDMKYKAYTVSPFGRYNEDVYNFYHQQRTELSKEITYQPYHCGRESQFTTNYALQYETMYWQGCEPIVSKMYDEQIGVIAPLYLKKIIPKYFIVFKTPGPSNITRDIMDDSDDTHTEPLYALDVQELLSKSVVVKSFDLSSQSPLGRYLYNYTTQSTWQFEPMYVNIASRETTYFGIDYKSGKLTNRTESFANTLCRNDLTVQIHDEYFTEGYFRNDLIYPNILNIEFIFNDDELQDLHFGRYWGLYCNNIEFLKSYTKDTDFISNETVLNPDGTVKEFVYVEAPCAAEYLNEEYVVHATCVSTPQEKLGRMNIHLKPSGDK